MSRRHHFLFLGLIIACVVGAVMMRRAPPAARSAPQPLDAPAPSASRTVASPDPADDSAVRARITKLSEMESEASRRERAAVQTFYNRRDLRVARHDAWTSVISANRDAFQTLRKAAQESPNKEVPCTICDGKGYMHFCILCGDKKGKCVTCNGGTTSHFGELCPTCSSPGKCFLCHGSGKMHCPYCDDGMIKPNGPPPPKEMPINCEEVASGNSNAKERLREQRPESLKTVSAFIQEGQSIQQALREDHQEKLANAPPTFWEQNGDHTLLGLMILLGLVLTRTTLTRHKEEAEIRRLTGAYLRDGTEAARFKMPVLFDVPTAAEAASEWATKDLKEGEQAPQAAPVVNERVIEFFKGAGEQVARIRELLPELGDSLEGDELKETYLALHELILGLKAKADCWDLRPVWQLTSALELLVKRLADKCKDATPSTTRTIATAVDLLADICVPGVRPDLIINPPIAVLAVDDDPLCLRAVMFALQKVEMIPDTAEDGEGAVLLATDKSYDVIFMDIKMPGIDGLQACEQIRKLKRNANTPVVFVTVQSDFRTRTESALVGGSDLLVKPFLMFEITVKVLIFTMRKRLGLAASLKREVASLTGAKQLEGIPMITVPPPSPVSVSAPPVFIAAAQTNGHHAAPEQQHEAKIELSRVEFSALHMAPVAPLEREVRVPQTPQNGSRKSRKWLRRRKEEVVANSE